MTESGEHPSVVVATPLFGEVVLFVDGGVSTNGIASRPSVAATRAPAEWALQQQAGDRVAIASSQPCGTLTTRPP